MYDTEEELLKEYENALKSGDTDRLKSLTRKRVSLLEQIEKGNFIGLGKIVPDRCAGQAMSLFSMLDSYNKNFKEITGIDVNDPIVEDISLEEYDMYELNLRAKDVKRSLESLCSCMS